MASTNLNIPVEILLIIFTHLEAHDLLECCLVCKSWLELICANKKLTNRFQLSLTPQNLPIIVANYLFKRNYNHVTLREVSNFPPNYPWTSLDHVHHLVIDNCEFHWNLEVTARLVQHLKNVTRLDMYIGPTSGLDSCLEQLNALPSLSRLTVVLKPNFKRDFLLNLDALESLEHFSLGYDEEEPPFLSQARTNVLKVPPGEQRLTQLKSFKVSRLRVKAITLQQIFRRFPHLEHLELANSCKGVDWTAAHARPEVVEETISNLRNLRALVIDDVAVEDERLWANMDLPELETIRLVRAENMLLSELRDYVAKTVKIHQIRRKCPKVQFE